MAKLLHLDALTRRLALTLLHALLRTKQPGDAARAAIIQAWLIEQLMILGNVLPFAQFELLDMGHALYRSTGTAPTLEELSAYLNKIYEGDLNEGTILWHEYQTLLATFPTIGLPQARAVLESIFAALTVSPQFPDAPIRRRADGTFLDSAYGPALSGAPSERLLHFCLYYASDGVGYMPLRSIHAIVGGSLTALQGAVRSQFLRGIVERSWERGVGPIVRLRPVYSRAAADERAEFSRRLTPAYADEQRWKRNREDQKAEDAAALACYREDSRRRAPEPDLESWTPITDDAAAKKVVLA